MIGKRGYLEGGWLEMACFIGGVIEIWLMVSAERSFFLDWKMMCDCVIGFHEGSCDEEKQNCRERHSCHFSGLNLQLFEM
jgi:hypothetical protein